jgi:hypothetical protein
MSAADSFHFLTVGTTPELVCSLWDPIAAGSEFRFSHLMHPRYDRNTRLDSDSKSEKYFVADDIRVRLPAPDPALLSSLEAEGVPTVHNMILGDRVVSALPYHEALGYATLLARRMIEVFGRVRPMAVIGGFDALHGSLALGVALKMGIPWYAMHFSVIPEGFVCFCDRVSPSARVCFENSPFSETEALAARSLAQFESREIVAPAYIAPIRRSVFEHLSKIASRLSTLSRMVHRVDAGGLRRYTEPRAKHSISYAIRHLVRAARARKAVAGQRLLTRPPPDRYVLFGLHMQPESSIDVWAPFFSNQLWVIELLSRSIPPTHKVLVKIHKSDTGKYSSEELDKISAYPGVELVAPFADTRSFIEQAELLVLIQGTIGLEAALLGKPVIMIGQSAFSILPSVTQIGNIVELPALIRKKLREERPSRVSILRSYAEYLRPFAPASTNDWTIRRKGKEIDDYRRLFSRLRRHIIADSSRAGHAASKS